MKKIIKLLIVDDHTAVRQTLSTFLKDFAFETIYEASNGKEAIELLKNKNPDLILMDIDMPVMTGLEALKLIKLSYPTIKVIMLSGHTEHFYVTEALTAGADAFLPKHCSIETLLAVMEDVMENRPFVFENIIDSPVPMYGENPNPSTTVRGQRLLTQEEIGILVAMCEGKSDEEITGEFNMTLNMLTAHTETIYEKTLLTNKIALVKYAFKNGYLS